MCVCVSRQGERSRCTPGNEKLMTFFFSQITLCVGNEIISHLQLPDDKSHSLSLSLTPPLLDLSFSLYPPPKLFVWHLHGLKPGGAGWGRCLFIALSLQGEGIRVAEHMEAVAMAPYSISDQQHHWLTYTPSRGGSPFLSDGHIPLGAGSYSDIQYST